MSVKINALASASLIRTGGSTRYIIFKITGQADPAQAARVPLNLSLVLDRSGSMSGENKLELVKQAAAFVLDSLTSQDRVSLVAFDDEVRLAGPSQPLTAANRDRFKRELQALRPGGSTNLSEGWFKGLEQLALYQDEKAYINQVWLFTDGLANCGITDQEELSSQAGKFRRNNILTTTFGVGHDTDEILLEALAEKGGGRFQHIESAGKIRQTFAGELNERLNTVGRDLALQLNLPVGIGAKNLNDYEMAQPQGRCIMRLGDIYAGEEKLIVVQLKTPAGLLGQVLRPEAILMYTDPLSGTGHEVRPAQDLSLTYAGSAEISGQRLDAESAVIIGRLMVEGARKEILAANRRGEYDLVNSIVDRLKRRLGRTHLLHNQAVLTLLAEIERQGQVASSAQLSVVDRKQMHYTSYTTQKSRRDYNIEPSTG